MPERPSYRVNRGRYCMYVVLARWLPACLSMAEPAGCGGKFEVAHCCAARKGGERAPLVRWVGVLRSL